VLPKNKTQKSQIQDEAHVKKEKEKKLIALGV
jgi:hypothetical protein